MGWYKPRATTNLKFLKSDTESKACTDLKVCLDFKADTTSNLSQHKSVYQHYTSWYPPQISFQLPSWYQPQRGTDFKAGTNLKVDNILKVHTKCTDFKAGILNLFTKGYSKKNQYI